MAAPRLITNRRTIKSICTKYERGASLSQLAEEYSVSTNTIRNYLLENDVEMRSRGGARRGN